MDAYTRLYCVLGDPIRHSLSPAIHNAAFQAGNVNAVYTAFQVKDLPAAMDGIRSLGISGASVTIPYKVQVMNYLDDISDLAQMIGSVNTITRQEGRLVGFNTDAYGFYRALLESTEIRNKTVAIFGSGGSARAVLFSLLHYDVPKKVFVIARNAAQRNELVQNIRESLLTNRLTTEPYHPSVLEDGSMEDWQKWKDQVDIVINTTPVGMQPDAQASILSIEEIPQNSVVMDLVYRPHQTRLLRDALEKGCKVVYGVDMLLYQAVQQYELWTNQSAPERAMRLALQGFLDNLEKQ